MLFLNKLSLSLLLSLSLVSSVYSYEEIEQEILTKFSQQSIHKETKSRWNLLLNGSIDFRAYRSGKSLHHSEAKNSTSPKFGGKGLTRYGGVDRDGNGTGDQNTKGFALSRFSLIPQVFYKRKKALVIHLAAQDFGKDQQNDQFLDIIEAKGFYKTGQFAFKAGYFIPSFSMENEAKDWSSPYTLSFSNINTWFGEELRVTGIEAKWMILETDHELSLAGSLFSGADALGSVLLLRGWAIHDYLAGTNTELRYNLHPSLSTTEGQYNQTKDVDGRMGYYAHLEYDHQKTFFFNLGFFDNNGQSNFAATPDGNRVFRTKFYHTGIKYHLHSGLSILGQYISGTTNHRDGISNVFDFEWSGYYGLINYHWDKHSLSYRYDSFEVKDTITSSRWKHDGDAHTLGYFFNLSAFHRLGAEIVLMDAPWNNNKDAGDDLFQISYKMRF